MAETQFAGEIVLRDAAPELVPGQMRVADLRVGNWLLLAKRLKPNNPENKAVYRWTRIIGDDGREGVTGVDRRFTLQTMTFSDQPRPVALSEATLSSCETCGSLRKGHSTRELHILELNVHQGRFCLVCELPGEVTTKIILCGASRASAEPLDGQAIRR